MYVGFLFFVFFSIQYYLDALHALVYRKTSTKTVPEPIRSDAVGKLAKKNTVVLIATKNRRRVRSQQKNNTKEQR